MDTVDDLLSRIIEHMLVPSLTVIPPGCLDHPVRMCAIEITVLVDHLEFYPETEFYTDLLHLFGQSVDT